MSFDKLKLQNNKTAPWLTIGYMAIGLVILFVLFYMTGMSALRSSLGLLTFIVGMLFLGTPPLWLSQVQDHAAEQGEELLFSKHLVIVLMLFLLIVLLVICFYLKFPGIFFI